MLAMVGAFALVRKLERQHVPVAVAPVVDITVPDVVEREPPI